MSNAPIQTGVHGSSRRVWFLFIPLGSAPSIREAVDACLDKASGDFMERVRIYGTDWTLILFSYGSYSVQGEVGNSKFEQMEAR